MTDLKAIRSRHETMAACYKAPSASFRKQQIYKDRADLLALVEDAKTLLEVVHESGKSFMGRERQEAYERLQAALFPGDSS